MGNSKFIFEYVMYQTLLIINFFFYLQGLDRRPRDTLEIEKKMIIGKWAYKVRPN